MVGVTDLFQGRLFAISKLSVNGIAKMIGERRRNVVSSPTILNCRTVLRCSPDKIYRSYERSTKDIGFHSLRLR